MKVLKFLSRWHPRGFAANDSAALTFWGGFASIVAAMLLAGCDTLPPSSSGQQQAAAGDFTPLPNTPTQPQPSAAPSAAATNAPVAVDPRPTAADANVDVIAKGESLSFVFNDLPVPVQPMNLQVKDDGTVTLLHNKTFVAVGKTRRELEKEIRDAYVPGLYKNLTVSIMSLERFYWVDGEVKAPSRQIYAGRTSVLKAIGSCGGFTDYANKKKVLVTRLGGRTETVNCLKALENPRLDLEIFPGDKVYVRRSWL